MNCMNIQLVVFVHGVYNYLKTSLAYLVILGFSVNIILHCYSMQLLKFMCHVFMVIIRSCHSTHYVVRGLLKSTKITNEMGSNNALFNSIGI